MYNGTLNSVRLSLKPRSRRSLAKNPTSGFPRTLVSRHRPRCTPFLTVGGGGVLGGFWGGFGGGGFSSKQCIFRRLFAVTPVEPCHRNPEFRVFRAPPPPPPPYRENPTPGRELGGLAQLRPEPRRYNSESQRTGI